MLINKINIKNYKSLVDFELFNPEPFSVFFGTNASGKSNIFELFELIHILSKLGTSQFEYIYNIQELLPFRSGEDTRVIKKTKDEFISIKLDLTTNRGDFHLTIDSVLKPILKTSSEEIGSLIKNDISRIFIGQQGNQRIPQRDDDSKLNFSARNFEKVLKRLLKDPKIKVEIKEWMELLVPEFKEVDIVLDELTQKEKILISEEYANQPFPKNLISDGTINILCLLTAVYQSPKSQFLLIEEPENGLNPKVIKELVSFFRNACSEHNHHIWLNTHSQSLVSELKSNEAILIEKTLGKTQAKQFKDIKLYDLRMDEAWLANVLGGGIPW